MWDGLRAIGEWLEVLKPYREWVAAIVGCFGVWKWMDQRLKRQLVMRIATADALLAAEKRIAQLESDVALSERFDPANWLNLTRRELHDKNAEKALAVLKDSVSLREDELREVFHSLAQQSFAMAKEGPYERRQFEEARRYAELARLLGRDTSGLLTLVEELEIHAAAQELQAGQQVGTLLPDAFLGLDPSVARGVVESLAVSARAHLQQSELLIAERLAARARDIALPCFGASSYEACMARWTWAEVQLECSQPSKALEELDQIVPIATELYGESSLLTLGYRYMRARALHRSRRLQDGLKEITGALTLREQCGAPMDLDMFNNHLLRALLLEGNNEMEGFAREIRWLKQNADLARLDANARVGAASAEARLQERRRDIEGSVRTLEAALRDAGRAMGQRDLALADLRTNLARMLAKAGKLESALVEVELAMRTLGEVAWRSHSLVGRADVLRQEIMLALRGSPKAKFVDWESDWPGGPTPRASASRRP